CRHGRFPTGAEGSFGTIGLPALLRERPDRREVMSFGNRMMNPISKRRLEDFADESLANHAVEGHFAAARPQKRVDGEALLEFLQDGAGNRRNVGLPGLAKR